MKSLVVTIQIHPLHQYFYMVLFLFLHFTISWHLELQLNFTLAAFGSERVWTNKS